jgi:hypothetical protein
LNGPNKNCELQIAVTKTSNIRQREFDLWDVENKVRHKLQPRVLFDRQVVVEMRVGKKCQRGKDPPMEHSKVIRTFRRIRGNETENDNGKKDAKSRLTG